MRRNKNYFLMVGVILGNVTATGCWYNAAVGLSRHTSATKTTFGAGHVQLLLRLPSCVIRTEPRHVDAPVQVKNSAHQEDQ
jgi:hypothetical protein